MKAKNKSTYVFVIIMTIILTLMLVSTAKSQEAETRPYDDSLKPIIEPPPPYNFCQNIDIFSDVKMQDFLIYTDEEGKLTYITLHCYVNKNIRVMQNNIKFQGEGNSSSFFVNPSKDSLCLFWKIDIAGGPNWLFAKLTQNKNNIVFSVVEVGADYAPINNSEYEIDKIKVYRSYEDLINSNDKMSNFAKNLINKNEQNINLPNIKCIDVLFGRAESKPSKDEITECKKMVEKLDSDDYRIRIATATELRKQKYISSLVEISNDIKSLSAEQQLIIEAILDSYFPPIGEELFNEINILNRKMANKNTVERYKKQHADDK